MYGIRWTRTIGSESEDMGFLSWEPQPTMSGARNNLRAIAIDLIWKDTETVVLKLDSATYYPGMDIRGQEIVHCYSIEQIPEEVDIDFS